MENQHGVFIQGICKGYVAEPWRSDPNKVNHIVGVARLVTDRFSEMKEDVFSLNLYSDPESVKRLSEQANKFKGKTVRIQVFPSAKPGKSGPWTSYLVPKEANIECLEK